MCITMKLAPLFIVIALLACSCGSSRGVASSSNDRNTYSHSKVNMENAGTYKDIYEYLQGKVPGVQIVGTSIRIRGINSNNNTDALIILDGMEASDVSDVNPADVASVEVLKDSEATLYGMRGANGVVIIKTKTANDDK